MSLDIQPFDLDKDPAVLALEEFTADVQVKITAEISPELAQQQAAFAKQIEQANPNYSLFINCWSEYVSIYLTTYN